jgi:hypothetical protein
MCLRIKAQSWEKANMLKNKCRRIGKMQICLSINALSWEKADVLENKCRRAGKCRRA